MRLLVRIVFLLIPLALPNTASAFDASSHFESHSPRFNNRRQFEESPLVHGASSPIELTSSPSGHDNRSLIKASSLNESAPIVPSSLTSNDNVQKSPRSPRSAPSVETSSAQNPVKEELSLSDLMTKWDLAKQSVQEREKDVDKANETLINKQKEAVEPNRVYEEKKKEWEELEGKAQESKDKEDAASKAKTDFEKANNTLNNAIQKLVTAEQNLADSSTKIAEANEALVELERVPANLTTTTERRNTKIAGKQTLIAQVEALETAERAAKGLWNTAVNEARIAQMEYDNLQCLLPAKNTTQACISELALLGTKNKAVVTTKANHETALAALKGPEKELKDFDDDLTALDNQIEDLTSKNDSLDLLVQLAKRRISQLEGLVPSLNQKIGNATENKRLAAEDLARKEQDKTTADADVKALPADATTARTAADIAKHKMDLAKQEKDIIDGKVNVLSNELAKAKDSLDQANKDAKTWKDRYEIAERKDNEEQARKSAAAAMIGGVVGGLACVVIAIVVILLVCFMRKLCCFKKKPPLKAGPPTSKPKDNNSRSKKGSKNNKSGDKKGSKSSRKTATKPKNPPEQTPTATPAPSATSVKEIQAPTPLVPPTPAVIVLEDFAAGPFEPKKQEGQKVPATFFKWKGPMRRRKRWHGPPEHDFEGGRGESVTCIDKLCIDPNECEATEIGETEIMEDHGPASDSDRSELLNDLAAWNEGHLKSCSDGTGIKPDRSICWLCRRINADALRDKMAELKNECECEGTGIKDKTTLCRDCKNTPATKSYLYLPMIGEMITTQPTEQPLLISRVSHKPAIATATSTEACTPQRFPQTPVVVNATTVTVCTPMPEEKASSKPKERAVPTGGRPSRFPQTPVVENATTVDPNTPVPKEKASSKPKGGAVTTGGNKQHK